MISLHKKPIDWLKIVKVSTLISYFSIFLLLMYFFSIINNGFLLLIIMYSAVACFFKIAQYSKKITKLVREKYYLESLLYNFILNNNLYKEKQDKFEIYENGKSRTKSRVVLESSAQFSYQETTVEIIILAHKRGDIYSKRMEALDVELQGLLALPIENKEILPDVVKYTFLKEKPLREQVTTLPKDDDSLLIQIHCDFIINLRNNYSMLISGASGAGKSYFTYFYLTRFISQKVNNNHAKIMAIDPKQSDLYKLFKTVNMPAENYGTSNADAFRIVKHYLAEMEHRMALYDESPSFDSVGIDIGLEPTLLVIEEYSSLVASMDSKQKKSLKIWWLLLPKKLEVYQWVF
ncbi:hypothetical protein [Enterococcus rivorum]|uniref:hypothetical protein n=1 Tax=Enterococcus rivorum TaxID=762845 RepID=UPI0036437896